MRSVALGFVKLHILHPERLEPVHGAALVRELADEVLHGAGTATIRDAGELDEDG